MHKAYKPKTLTRLLRRRRGDKNIVNYRCKLSKVPDYEFSKHRAGLIFKKNWPFTRLVNHHLLEMKEKGILDRYFRPYDKTTKETCDNEVLIRPVLNVPHPVSLYTTVFLFLVISGGFLCSFGVFLLELISKNRCGEM